MTRRMGGCVRGGLGSTGEDVFSVSMLMTRIHGRFERAFASLYKYSTDSMNALAVARMGALSLARLDTVIGKRLQSFFVRGWR